MDCECGCGRQAAPGRRLSWACHSARSRHGSTTRKRPERGVRYETDKEMVLEAHIAYEAADPLNTKEHTNAWARLRTAWRRYFERTAKARLNTANKATKTTR